MQGIRRMSAFLVEYARDSAPKVEFPEDPKRGKRSSTGIKPLEGALCPLCGKPVQENVKAFGCSDWKGGCRFTLWKDGLARAGGPALNAKIVLLLLQNGQVAGSTGTVALNDGYISFTKKGDAAPCVSVPIVYEKKSK